MFGLHRYAAIRIRRRTCILAQRQPMHGGRRLRDILAGLGAVIWLAFNGLLWYSRPSDELWLLGSALLGIAFFARFFATLYLVQVSFIHLTNSCDAVLAGWSCWVGLRTAVRVFRRGLAARPRNDDCDRLRHDRGIVRDMVGVAQQELKCVLAWGEGDRRFGLTSSEMQMIEIIRYRFVERGNSVSINR